MIEQAKKCGLNTISTYIPWRWHEYKEGKFDFRGETLKERNLLAFLDLVEKAGMYLSLRPGPMCHGEILDDGLPAWLMDNYPQIRLKKADGSLFRGSMISLMHPDYLKLVEKWYAKIMPIILQRQITRGKNIILVQLDNEISMINWLTKIPDSAPGVLEGYRAYLEEKYGKISNLNKTYQKKFNSFKEINYPAINYDKQPSLFFWDWVAYWRTFYSDYYLHLANLARAQGINVPLIANIAHFADVDVRGRGLYSPMTTSMFREFPLKVDNLILGGAYQMRRLDYENFHDIYITSEAVKMVSDKASPCFCVEMQSGIMFDRPRLYPQDVALNTLTSLASGLNGFNAYMFASGKNVASMGNLGTNHDWQAAVGLDGRPRLHYYALKRSAKIIKTFKGALSKTKKEADVSIGFYLPYYETEFLTGDFVKQLESKRNTYFFEGLLRLLTLKGISYEFIDIRNKEIKTRKPLIVFSLEFMDRITQDKILSFVRSGGRLLLGPVMPEFDLNGKKERLLANKFGIKTKKTNSRYIKQKGELYIMEEPNYTFLNKGKILLKNTASQALALSLKYNQGKAVFYGFGLISMFDYYLDLLEALIKELGVKKRVNSSSDLMPAVLRSDKASGFLFIANYHQIPLSADYRIMLGGKALRFPSRGQLYLPMRTGRILPLNFEVNSDLKIIMTTLQILDINQRRSEVSLEIEAAPGFEEEIIFKTTKSYKVYLNNKLLKKLEAGRRQAVRFKAEMSVNKLILK
jgi:beta-galactosidase